MKRATTLTLAAAGVFGLSLFCGCFVDDDWGPCFGLQRGRTYEVEIVERYDADSQFEYTLNPELAPCSPELQLTDGQTFRARVAKQRDDEQCDPNWGELTEPLEVGDIAIFGEASSASPSTAASGAHEYADVMTLPVVEIDVNGNGGKWIWSVIADADAPLEEADPFIEPVVGERPRVLLTRLIGWDASETCVDSYVIRFREVAQ